MAAIQTVRSEFLVNTFTASDQAAPVVVGFVGADAGFAIVWQTADSTSGDGDGYAVKTKAYNADGTEAGSEQLVNSTADGDQWLPAVASMKVGASYVVAFEDAEENDILGRLVDFNGTGTTATDFSINASGVSSDPTVCGLISGSFVVAWVEDDTSSLGIKASIFNSTGTSVVAEFTVNTTTADDQMQPSIAALEGGGFVVAWLNTTDSDPRGSIRAQIYSDVGATVGGEFTINNSAAAVHDDPQVAGLTNGGFVVVWRDNSGGNSLRGQVFSATGTEVGSEFQVETSSIGAQDFPKIAALTGGGFVIVWQSDESETAFDDIKAQAFTANGTKIGSEFTVNTTTTGNQASPSVAGLDNGGFVVAWQDSSGLGGDADPTSIKAQIFALGTAALADARAVAEYATVTGNVVTAGAVGEQADFDPDDDDLEVTAIERTGGAAGTVGNALVGAKGTLTLNADGSYTYLANLAEPLAIGATVQDSFTYTISDGDGHDDETTLVFTITGVANGNGAGNQLLGNAGANTMHGNGGNDTIRGAGGRDTLFGDANVDTLVGGAGRDTMTGGAARDIFDFNAVGETGKTAATRDIIKDFKHNLDEIDLSTIDANGSAPGHRFSFLAAKGAAFTGAKGQIRWLQENKPGTANDKTIIQGDVNGNKVADFHIELKGLITLTAGDFLL